MHRLRHHLRRFTWLALVAMLGLALAPSVSQALGAPPGSGVATDICSVASQPGEAPGSGGAGFHVEHCALCCVAGHAIGLPPAPVAGLTIPDGADPVAALFVDAAHGSLAWRPPQARAPPQFC